MKLLCIAGFLGSGKTTVLLELARTMTQSGLQLAIVENEIGDVGVDGGYVREAGLPVQELFGGCICCTLQTGLVETLRALAALRAIPIERAAAETVAATCAAFRLTLDGPPA